MRVEINELRATQARDVHKVRFEDKNDYNKVKWLMSMIPIKWSAKDFTRTIYFLGKKPI